MTRQPDPTAIERYLASAHDDQLTARLNSVYGVTDSAVEQAFAEAQRRVLRRTEWCSAASRGS